MVICVNIIHLIEVPLDLLDRKKKVIQHIVSIFLMFTSISRGWFTLFIMRVGWEIDLEPDFRVRVRTKFFFGRGGSVA